jgi:phenylacetate-coenzyme A ligase PaaK-like adenylate-forming protein
MNLHTYKEALFTLNTSQDFEILALWAFSYQYNYNPVYRKFVDLTERKDVKTVDDIPFLPISFFKTNEVICDYVTAEIIFKSSGTTGQRTSTHFIQDVLLYEKSCDAGFEFFFEKKPSEFSFLCLLPSYLERGNSSLVYMAQHFIEQSTFSNSGFYLKANDLLIEQIRENEKNKIPTILLGVTYALLDLSEKLNIQLQYTHVMETGGMKGRRKEMIREELHHLLKKSFGVDQIYSEYGMTELLSQAYLRKDGLFMPPPWMKIFIRDIHDPFQKAGHNRTGGINVIDLANIHSCCFIETQDLGMTYHDNTFSVLGRFDHSDMRGCNLMIE